MYPHQTVLFHTRGLGPFDFSALNEASLPVLDRLAASRKALLCPIGYLTADGVDPDADLDWVDVIQVLLDEGYDVREATIETWHDSGTPQDLLAINLAMLTEEWLNVVADRVEYPGASLRSQGEQSVSGEARFGGHVLLGPGVVVEPGASISNAVVGPAAHIGRGAEIANTLILPGAHLPSNARVSDAVWS